MRPALLLILLLALVSVPALAANELTNGDFDTDVSGWGLFEPVSIAWDPLDVDASPSSGSLKLTTMPPAMNSDFHGAVSECIAATAGEDLEAAAWAYIPSGHFGPVQAMISVQQFSSPTCQPLDLVHIADGPIATALDQWVELAFTSNMQGGVITAQVYVQARESAGGMQDPTTTHWDAVFLPEPGAPGSLLAGASLMALLARRRSTRKA